MNLTERILRKLPSASDEECWITDYATGPTGYCNVTLPDRSTVRLHRLAWEMHNAEPLPDGVVLMHTCDNPACCNPHHLVPGTQADNLKDMAAKGRGRKPLVPVAEAQRLSDEGFNHRQIAELLGFTRGAISYALKHYAS